MIDNVQKELLTQLNKNLGPGKFLVDYSSRPEPKDTYGTLGITTVVQQHTSEERFNSEEDDKMSNEVLETFAVLVNVHTYGKEAYPLAEQAMSLFKFRDITDELLKKDISIIDAGSVRRIPDKRDTQFISHASFDIRLYTRASYKRYVDWFNTVKLHERINNPGGNSVIDGNIEVKTQR